MCVVVTGTYCTDLEDWDLNLLNSPGAVHSVPSCNTQDRRGTDQREPVGERKRGERGSSERRLKRIHLKNIDFKIFFRH